MQSELWQTDDTTGRRRRGVSQLRKLAPLALWCLLLIVALFVVTALGRGRLAAPPLADPDAWGAWAAARTPDVIAFSLLRLLVLVIGWYLLGVTIIGAAARVARSSRAVRLADLLTVPAVRRLLQGALGVGLATAALVGQVSGEPAAAEPAPSAAAVALAGERASTATLRLLPDDDAERAVLALHTPGDEAAELRLATDAGATGAAVGRETPAWPQRWEVQPGEHFWAKAEAVITSVWGRAPSDAEVVGYWQQLIEANRAAMADPGNPDLIYPGQVFTVPEPPAPPGGS